MKLRELTMEALKIPMKVNFQHASASRSTTESVLVTAAAESGRIGLGEGCPRDYVTGETVASCLVFFEAHRKALLSLTSLDALTAWEEENSSLIDRNPAAFCAIELAMLNLLAAEAGDSVESLLGLQQLTGEFRYTAVIGASDSNVFRSQLQQYRQFGFTDYKIKLFGEPEIDQANISSLNHHLDSATRVRADANNLWSDAEQAFDYLNTLNYGFVALEEPLGKARFGDCGSLSVRLGLPVILDESFTRQEDFKLLTGLPGTWVINLRVSKMGGILRSLAIATEARLRGIALVIGAQVGETSLLTRAALTIASTCRDILMAQEGAFGTRLLKRDLIEPAIEFGVAGILTAGSVQKADAKRLKR